MTRECEDQIDDGSAKETARERLKTSTLNHSPAVMRKGALLTTKLMSTQNLRMDTHGGLDDRETEREERRKTKKKGASCQTRQTQCACAR